MRWHGARKHADTDLLQHTASLKPLSATKQCTRPRHHIQLASLSYIMCVSDRLIVGFSRRWSTCKTQAGAESEGVGPDAMAAFAGQCITIRGILGVSTLSSLPFSPPPLPISPRSDSELIPPNQTQFCETNRKDA
eukprot:3936923-Rhodomonas_salina.1